MTPDASPNFGPEAARGFPTPAKARHARRLYARIRPLFCPDFAAAPALAPLMASFFRTARAGKFVPGPAIR